jgi:hypothetical protein
MNGISFLKVAQRDSSKIDDTRNDFLFFHSSIRTYNYFVCFAISWLWVRMTMIIPETRSAYLIRYLRFLLTWAKGHVRFCHHVASVVR